MPVPASASSVASGSSPTSLVHLETNDQGPSDFRSGDDGPVRWAQTASQRQLHGRWWAERNRIIDALLVGSAALEKRALRIDGCCSHPALTKKQNGSVSMVLYCCRDRMCPRCQLNRGSQAARRIGSIIHAMNAPRTIELTVRHRLAPLAGEIDRLWSCFRELRRSKIWKQFVRGGVGVLEITINESDRTWHPHLHLVYDGEFFPYKLLSAEWERITKDSRVVWIKPVHDRAKTANYVGRYLAKSMDATTLTDVEIREFAEAVHGRRLVFTFGKTHNANPDPRPEPESHATDEPLLSLHRITGSADLGNPRAQRVVDLLRNVSPVWCSALGYLPFSTGGKPQPLTLADNQFIVDVCNELLTEPTLHTEVAEADAAAARRNAAELNQLLLGDFDEGPPHPYR